MTWKEGLWPAVCKALGIEAHAQDRSFRSYTFRKYEPGEVEQKSVYTGEVARLRSYENQRP